MHTAHNRLGPGKMGKKDFLDRKYYITWTEGLKLYVKQYNVTPSRAFFRYVMQRAQDIPQVASEASAAQPTAPTTIIYNPLKGCYIAVPANLVAGKTKDAINQLIITGTFNRYKAIPSSVQVAPSPATLKNHAVGSPATAASSSSSTSSTASTSKK